MFYEQQTEQKKFKTVQKQGELFQSSSYFSSIVIPPLDIDTTVDQNFEFTRGECFETAN